jgi:hypothetical protein
MVNGTSPEGSSRSRSVPQGLTLGPQSYPECSVRRHGSDYTSAMDPYARSTSPGRCARSGPSISAKFGEGRGQALASRGPWCRIWTK